MSHTDEKTIEWLQREIRRHRLWRRLWSVFYFSAAALTVISAALATASAGLMDASEGGRLVTTVLACLATISASLEKLLKLREKWDLHRNVQTSLEMVSLRASAQLIDTEETVKRIDRIAQRYNTQLAEIGAAAGDSSGS